MSQPTLGALWRGWRDRLAAAGFATAALDSKLLTGHALGLTTLELATGENNSVSDAYAHKVAVLLERRLRGESVARIIGEREFYGLPFSLNEATLEPRPETELLVDLALDRLPQGGHLLDLGTGTGCIPISILANRIDATAVAVDLSPRALEAARRNGERNGVGERIDLRHGSWFEPLYTSPSGGEVDPSSGRVKGPSTDTLPSAGPLTRTAADLSREGRGKESFHLITSNPPYITSAVVDTLAPEVRDFDPRLALDGGPDGLAPYRIIAARARRWLQPGGWLLVEIGYDQGAAVSGLFQEAGLADVTIHRDLNGLDRVVTGHHILPIDA